MKVAANLTPKQHRFVEEYLVDINATQAAIRAGYSEKTANVTGPQNLVKPSIAGAVQKAFEERSKRVEVTQDDVIRGLYNEAIREGKGSSPSARVQAWSHLGNHLGMFIDRTENKNHNLNIEEITVIEVVRSQKPKKEAEKEANKFRESTGHILLH